MKKIYSFHIFNIDFLLLIINFLINKYYSYCLVRKNVTFISFTLMFVFMLVYIEILDIYEF